MASFAVGLSVQRWVAAGHLKTLSNALDAAIRNAGRLIVAMPPRHGKSELVSHYFPVWFLNRWPSKRVILCSYEADFASSWGRKVRNTITDNVDRLRVRIAGDSSAANRWDTTEGGGMVTAGVGGPITGRGADLLIIDDPVKNAEQANSATYRQRAWDWWTSTAYTRLEPGGVVVLVMTRWHQDDLAGRLLVQMQEGGETWHVVRLPALAEDDDPLGRSPGTALWPERYGVPDLQRIRDNAGDYVWQALYQQRPVLVEGAIWKRHYWRTYRTLPVTRLTIQAWDTAFKESEGADYSVCTTWAVGEHGFYLVDVLRERLEFPQLVQASQRNAERYDPSIILVEDHASGQSLIQVLRQDTHLPIVGRKMDKSKETRAWSVVGLAESGRLFLPDHAPWLSGYLSEMEDFPHGRHDDQVDSTTLALSYLRPLAGDRLQAGSDVDTDHAPSERMTFGNQYERPTIERGTPLSPWASSRWAKVRGGRR